MSESLDGQELLRVARETLMGELAPTIPAERRYELLMIDNAMSIAARELEAGEMPARRALQRLSAIYGEPPATPTDLHERLVRDIRAGRFDAGPERERVQQHLRQTALDAVRLSNPRFIERRGFA